MFVAANVSFLTDNDQYLENSVSEHFGDIRIKFRRCTIVGPRRPLLVIKPPEMLNDPIHERRKKATTHRVGYDVLAMFSSEIYCAAQVHR